MNEADPWRVALACWIERPAVHNLLIALIVTNAVILGMQTSAALVEDWGALLVALDSAILAVFVVEIALRIAAHRLAFFRDPRACSTSRSWRSPCCRRPGPSRCCARCA